MNPRHQLRSWRSAKRILKSISDSQHDVSDSYTSLGACVEDVMEVEVDTEGSFKDDALDDDMKDCLEDDLSNDDLEDSLGDDLEEFDLDVSAEKSLSSALGAWASQYQVKSNAVDALLKTLRAYGHPELPSSSRTLLRYHTVPDSIDLSFNIDGLPLFKSSGRTMWPVLCAVHLKPTIVFPVTLTCGGAKPTDLHFLDDMVADINNLLSSGPAFRCLLPTADAKGAPSWQHSTTGFAHQHGFGFSSGLHAPGMLGGHEEASTYVEQG